MVSLKLPLWLRFVLLVGIVGLVSGASLIAYRYYTRPVTLSVAAGSIDGEAAKAMSAIASRLVSTNAPVRLMVIPLTGKYLSLVRDIFQQGPKALPTLIPIESAGAIAEAERAYESFDIPKGTLRGAPPVPDDDVTTLRTNLYLVAGKALGSDLVTTLTQTI